MTFCRLLHQACPGSVIVNGVYADADRCPSGMTNIPMPVSLRDISIFCLFVGMECTSASLNNRHITMSGPAGSITSSTHPVLGSCLHYTPPQDGFRFGKIGIKIDTSWILRCCGRIRIGNNILTLETDQHKLSSSKSPFRDPSSDDWDEKTGEKTQVSSQQGDVKLLTVSSLNFYWICQMSIVPGYWATPFKSSTSSRLGVFWGGQQVLLKALTNLLQSSTGSNVVAFWDSRSAPNVLCGSNTLTFPPYGVRHGATGEMMSREVVSFFAESLGRVECSHFDCQIPQLLVRTLLQCGNLHVG